jgi:hypothetical protein
MYAGQLAGLLYEFDSQGRMRIESKEKARARGASSPDRAEALMLALCKPPPKYEFYSVRDLSRMRSQSTGKRYYPEDHRSPRSRQWDGWVGRFDMRELRKHF